MLEPLADVAEELAQSLRTLEPRRMPARQDDLAGILNYAGLALRARRDAQACTDPAELEEKLTRADRLEQRCRALASGGPMPYQIATPSERLEARILAFRGAAMGLVEELERQELDEDKGDDGGEIGGETCHPPCVPVHAPRRLDGVPGTDEEWSACEERARRLDDQTAEGPIAPLLILPLRPVRRQ